MLLATWSDDDSDSSSNEKKEVNLCLIAQSNYSSDEESENEVTNSSYDLEPLLI